MKAQPGPMVSGSHFFPKAPLLWVKWIPAWAVMSRKVTCAGEVAAANRKSSTSHGDTASRRNASKERPEFSLSLCLTCAQPKGGPGFLLGDNFTFFRLRES